MFFWVKNTNHVYSFTAFSFFLEGGGGAFLGGKNAFCPPTFVIGGGNCPPAPPTSGAYVRHPSSCIHGGGEATATVSHLRDRHQWEVCHRCQ